MIDLEQKVEVTLCSSNISYYEELGYDINKLRRPNRDKIMTVPRRTKLKVKLKHVPLGSSIKIEVICDYCGEKYYPIYGSINKRKSLDEIIKKDCCNHCKAEKIKESNLIIYGREFVTSKYDLESAKEIFAQNNAILLATEFIQVKEKMPYICELHENKEIQYTSLDCVLQNNFCKFCKSEALKETGKPFDEIKEEFSLRGYDALYETNKKQHRVIHYICEKHPEKGIQKSFYTNFKRGHGCKECHFEKYRGEFGTNWQGGISELKSYLRENITDWKFNSRILCDYKCIITGEKFKNLHHLYGFDNIIKEMALLTKIPIGLKVNQYSKEELLALKDICNEIHEKYGLGACLSIEIHKLFHSNYGYGNNTHLQFTEFINRLLLGEFDDYLKENILTLNINYEALNKLGINPTLK